MTTLRFIPAALLVAGVVALSQRGAAADPTKEGARPVIIDSTGKEITLRKWKIVGGTRKAGWLPGGKTEFFELREFGSTTFEEGVLTLVPLARIESIKYDYEQETASVHLAGLEKPLQGTTKFKKINSITIEAEVDQGKSGVVDLRYRGGVIKVGFKEVKFPDAKLSEAPPPKGELFSFLVAPEGKGKTATVVTALNVQGLYRFGDGTEKLFPWLMFKKTLKVEIGNIQSMTVGDFSVKEKTAECEVTLKDGMQLSVTLLSHVNVDGKPATLVGLLGEVPVGWKLFPIHAFQQFQPGELKIEEPKEPAKKQPKKKGESKKDEPKMDEPKKDEPKKDEPKKE